MLKYSSNESKKSSHFFINTNSESIHVLSFKSVEEEIMSFNDDFLQENVVEMQIVRVTDQRETFCTALSVTIKSIFDKLLYKYDDLIIYLSVPHNSCKENLIYKYIVEDTNDEFFVYNVTVDGYTMFFFFNEHKTSSVNCLNSIAHFFKTEYDIDLKMLL
jgi:hypothetical protein